MKNWKQLILHDVTLMTLTVISLLIYALCTEGWDGVLQMALVISLFLIVIGGFARP